MLLALTLLVARVDADDPHRAVPTDHLALVAHLLHRRSNLHNSLSPSLLGGIPACGALLVAVCDAAAAEVVGRELDLHPVARRDADVVHPHLPGYVSKHLVPVLQLDTEHGVGQRLDHRSFDQDRVVLGLGQDSPPTSRRARQKARKSF